MIYFNNCSSIDEVKAVYKKLAKEFHPDCGGDTATMQAINVEYAHACAKVIRGENLTTEDADEQVRLSEEYKTIGGKKSLDEIRAKYGSQKVNHYHQNHVLV